MTNGTVPTGPGQPYAAPAEHFRRQFDQLLPLLLRHLEPNSRLQHVAQCAGGVLDFTLTTPRLLGTTPGGPEALPALARTDQELSFTATQLNRQLSELRSGQLIRLVAATAGDAFFCDTVVPGLHLLGAVVGGGRHDIDAADETVARLARTLRRRLSLPSLNLGAFDTLVGEEETEREPEFPHLPPYAVGTVTHPLFEPCAGALSFDGAHYLAYHRDGAMLFSVDILGHDALGSFFRFIEPAARRRFYQNLGFDFDAIAAELNRKLHRVVSDPVVRLVLDVEAGAIYYFQVRPGEYLVGVTLKQGRVRDTDNRLRELADLAADATSG